MKTISRTSKILIATAMSLLSDNISTKDEALNLMMIMNKCHSGTPTPEEDVRQILAMVINFTNSNKSNTYGK